MVNVDRHVDVDWLHHWWWWRRESGWGRSGCCDRHLVMMVMMNWKWHGDADGDDALALNDDFAITLRAR